MTSDADLLAIQYRTPFLVSASGRIQGENDPDRSPGPRFSLAGCATGNVAGVGLDVAEPIAAELLTIAADEPPFVERNSPPVHLRRYIELLSRSGPAPRLSLGVTFVLPNRLAYLHDVELISSHTHEGERLLADLSAKGLPAGLLELGFRDASEFWPPWCAALHDGQVASAAFAARLSPVGAEAGVATVRSLRGRGYAAAATSGWAASPGFASHALFYSTQQSNASSQRVIARLGLRFLGASLGLA